MAFRWGLKALLAYRDDDAKSALEYLQKAHESDASDFAQAQNLIIRSLAEQTLGNSDVARESQQQAAEVIARLEQDPHNRGNADLLIAQILMREFQAASDNKAAP